MAMELELNKQTKKCNQQICPALHSDSRNLGSNSSLSIVTLSCQKIILRCTANHFILNRTESAKSTAKKKTKSAIEDSDRMWRGRKAVRKKEA